MYLQVLKLLSLPSFVTMGTCECVFSASLLLVGTYFPFILFPFFVAMNNDVMNTLVADFTHAHKNFLGIFLES